MSIRAVTLTMTGLFVVSACSAGSGTTVGNLAPPDKQILNVNDSTEPNSYDPTQQTSTFVRTPSGATASR